MLPTELSRRELLGILRPSLVTSAYDYPPLFTPTDELYRPLMTTYPVIAPQHWRLTLVHQDGKRSTFTLEDLQAFPAVNLDCTICSISHSQEEPRIATARWKGVKLRSLIGDHAGDLRVTSANGRTTDIPGTLIDQAVLAYHVNGISLPPEQGAPLRLITPGLEERWMPGWVRRIALLADRSILEANVYAIPVRSVILKQSASVGRSLLLQGYAYAGLQPIEEMALRVDDGAWMPIDSMPGDPGVWSRWAYDWQPQQSGTYHLQVRASAADQAAISQRVIRVETLSS
jgi:DMSO/TMAO reductase YedYZ molybdopterin-dependent catalytic subunit